MTEKQKRPEYSPPTRTRVNRCLFVNDFKGNPVVGLSWDKGNGEFYYTYFKTTEEYKKGLKSRKDFTFGLNYKEAVFKFRQWQTENLNSNIKLDDVDSNRMTVVSTGTKTLSPEKLEGLNRIRRELGFPDLESNKLVFGVGEGTTEEDFTNTKITKEIYMPEEKIWQAARELILEDITEARKKLNLPIVLENGIKLESKIKLKDLIDWYFEDRKKTVVYQYEYDCRRFWKEFCNTVQVSTLGKLTYQDVIRYHDIIHQRAKRKKWNPQTLNSRLSFIRAVFSRKPKRACKQSDRDNISKVYSWCKDFDFAQIPPSKPTPISKSDFHSVLKVSDDVFKAILLMALNCGMRQTALASTKINHIDFEKKTFSAPRPKTGIIRVAILWDRTLEAVNKILKNRNGEYDALFLDSKGEPISTKSISYYWRKYRKEAGLSSKIEFQHIRDATQNVPLDDNPNSFDEIRLIMGHTIPGCANNYTERTPNKVRRACKAIENYYFEKENANK